MSKYETVRQIALAIQYQGGKMETFYEGKMPVYSVFLDGQWYGPFYRLELLAFAEESL